jgi:uncharacterized protein YbjT (DUF2867 family)
MILVVGATGYLGTEICRRLTAQGESVRAMVRPTSNQAKVDALKSLGVELAQGDLKDRASLDRACQSITTVISTASACPTNPPGDSIPATDQTGLINLVDSAKVAGVSHFIYTSYSGNIEMDCPLTTAKRTVEKHLKQSGMAFTILRPSFFMEVWLSPALGFDYPNAKATIYGKGQNKISWISLGDVAQFAVDSVVNPAARDAVIEMGGPEALSPLDVVRIFETCLGKAFELQHVPEEALQAQKAQATDPLSQTFPALMLAYAGGDVVDMQFTQRNFPTRLTSLSDYAQQAMVNAR